MHIAVTVLKRIYSRENWLRKVALLQKAVSGTLVEEGKGDRFVCSCGLGCRKE
ncbi:MAG: hypothetical protein QF619_05840 [Candidatus Binatia bacterium]|nr:hypothetical protein [Candidatus Binatia bacterium]